MRASFPSLGTCSAFALVAAAVAAPSPVSAQAARPADPDTVQVYVLEPISVRGRRDDLTGSARTASTGYVGRADLGLRPLSREGEVLETVPGMILTQHSGGGKSNQMFVRGFNLDHGTDFATRLEGMPLNFPTHAHGHGYTDLNFIIPELVDHVEYALGNYYADIGDFGGAGGAHIRLRRAFDDGPFLKVGAGENGHQRLVAGTSGDLAGGTLLAGGELRSYDGPWVRPEELGKRSGLVRYERVRGDQSLSVLAMGYANDWQASDQIPRRAVESGIVTRFGQIDPTLGGRTSRYSLSGAWSRSTPESGQRLTAFVSLYDLDLFSNFTYRLEDASRGDQIRQQDDGRWTWGGSFAHLQGIELGGLTHDLTVGAELRGDRADLTLSRTSARETVGRVRRDRVDQWSGALYTELVSPWTDVFRTTLGLRGDGYAFDVESDRGANSGTARDAILSPKLSLAFGPWAGTEVYVSGGLGFHSNDARGAVTTVDPITEQTTEPVDPLVRSTGAEVGVRSTPRPGLRTTLALWTLHLDSELLFVGDAGNTEPSDPSRRTGVTLANFYRISPVWTADLDVSLTRARFLEVGRADRIPNALESVVAAGITYEPEESGPFASLRLRRFGSYPLIEDDSQRAEASALVNLNAGYRLGPVRLTVTVLNLLDEDHSDIQYYYASRLEGEPAGGVEDVHFHPAEPRQLRVSVSWGAGIR